MKRALKQRYRAASDNDEHLADEHREEDRDEDRDLQMERPTKIMRVNESGPESEGHYCPREIRKMLLDLRLQYMVDDAIPRWFLEHQKKTAKIGLWHDFQQSVFHLHMDVNDHRDDDIEQYIPLEEMHISRQKVFRNGKYRGTNWSLTEFAWNRDLEPLRYDAPEPTTLRSKRQSFRQKLQTRRTKTPCALHSSIHNYLK
jgi:hypothetical protein